MPEDEVFKTISSRTKHSATKKYKFLNTETMKMLELELLLSHFDYYCSSWYSSNWSELCLDYRFGTRCSHCHFNELHSLTVVKIVTQSKVYQVQRILNTILSYLFDYFSVVGNYHNFNTSQMALAVYRRNGLMDKESFSYSVTTEWNLLPNGVRK